MPEILVQFSFFLFLQCSVLYATVQKELLLMPVCMVDFIE